MIHVVVAALAIAPNSDPTSRAAFLQRAKMVQDRKAQRGWAPDQSEQMYRVPQFSEAIDGTTRSKPRGEYVHQRCALSLLSVSCAHSQMNRIPRSLQAAAQASAHCGCCCTGQCHSRWTAKRMDALGVDPH